MVGIVEMGAGEDCTRVEEMEVVGEEEDVINDRMGEAGGGGLDAGERRGWGWRVSIR